MEVYQCRLCPCFFETYTHAVVHLHNKHPRVRAGRNRGSTCLEHLAPVEFRLVEIPLSRVDDTTDNLIKAENGHQDVINISPPVQQELTSFQRSKQRKPWRSKDTVQKTKGGGVEIKLDSLKASEIETLMRDLYQGQNTAMSQSSSVQGPLIFSNLSQKSHKRRAASRVDQVLKNIEQDEQQEKDNNEEPPTVRRRRSARNYENEDEEYRPYYDGSDNQKKTRSNKPGPRMKSKKCSSGDEDGHDDDNIVADALANGETSAKFHCRVCNNLEFELEMKTEYLEHMRNEHRQDNAYPCSHCDAKFLSIMKFNRHWDRIKAPTKRYFYEKKFECDVCERKFIYKKELEKHQEIHERRKNDPNKRVKCPLCKFNFARLNSMQRHFVLHLENNPFICKLTGCGAKFGNSEHLARHVKLHSGVRNFACESCDRTFARADSLQKHISKIHSDSNKGRKNRRFRRREKFPTFVKSINDLAPDTYLGLTQSHAAAPFPSPDVIPKPELELNEIRWELESQHFTDHVTATSHDMEETNNTDLIKEEESAPVSEAKDSHKSEVSNSNSNDDLYTPDADEADEDSEDEGNEYNQPVTNSNPNPDEYHSSNASIRTIILRDPVYQKLLQDDPVAAASVLPLTHGYGGKGYNVPRQTFPCTKCEWSTARAFFLHKHMKTCHNIDMNLMLDKKSNPSTTTQNSDTVSNSVVLHCGSCGHRSTSAADLASHIREEHEPTPKFACSVCGIKFNALQKKILHEKYSHFTERKYACAKCPKKYATQNCLRQHTQKKHTPKSPAGLERSKCKTCGKQLACMLSLKAHMHVHTADQRVSCRICDQSCANKITLKRHIAYVHLNVPNPYNRSLKYTNMKSKEKENEVSSTAATANTNSGEDNVVTNSGNLELNSVNESNGDEMIVGL